LTKNSVSQTLLSAEPSTLIKLKAAGT